MKYLNEISYKDCIGKVCKSLNSGDFKVLKYNDTANVEIQFLNTGFEMVARLDHIRNGNVKDHYVPSVHGIGVVGNSTHLGLMVLLQKSIYYGRVCYRDVILLHLKRNTQLMKVVS